MDVAQFFLNLGWRDFREQPCEFGTKHLFGLRVDGPGVTNCQCNDKLSIHATHHRMSFANGHESVEFDITAEAVSGQWFVLKAYSISPDELTADRVEQIKRALMAAWESVQCARGIDSPEGGETGTGSMPKAQEPGAR